MRSSAIRSKILIFTKAVWGLAAEMEGELTLATEPDRDREAEWRDADEGEEVGGSFH
jgi:hypothetical protein